MDKHLAILSQCIDEFAAEQGKFQYYQRQVARQKQAQQSYIQKRATDNEIRSMTGKEPLPEEDLSKNPLFKPIPKPSRLETYLVSNQIAHYCEQVQGASTAALNKLYMVEALHRDQADSTTAPAAAQ